MDLNNEWGFHVEFVRGCGNTNCASFGTVCSTEKPKFMTDEHFKQVLGILERKDINIDSLFLYGLGPVILGVMSIIFSRAGLTGR